jgi:hypothetical protein
MSKEELWTIFTRKTPGFADPKSDLRITGKNVRKLFDQVWDQAFAAGQAAEKAKRPAPSIFERVFGKPF